MPGKQNCSKKHGIPNAQRLPPRAEDQWPDHPLVKVKVFIAHRQAQP